MTQFIKNLQQKSEAVKKTIMWFGVFLIMFLIFSIWILTFPSQIPETEDNQATQNLQNELPGVWNNLKTQVNNLLE